MNALGQQMAVARGGAALAASARRWPQACEIETCDARGPVALRASALGGTGQRAGDGNASTLTYNFGGTAAGIDYRLDPRFLVGIGAGYAAATSGSTASWAAAGRDSVSVAAYGSFTQGGFYADALAGYAYSSNRCSARSSSPACTAHANGSTGANQFLGQFETGYKIGLYAPAKTSITPFGRLQVHRATQAASANGAPTRSTSTSRSRPPTRCAPPSAPTSAARRRGRRAHARLWRFGWAGCTSSPTRPADHGGLCRRAGHAFTVYGATPQRDSAVIGFSAAPPLPTATSLYLRYDGEIGAAPTTTRSISACASPGEMAANAADLGWDEACWVNGGGRPAHTRGPLWVKSGKPDRAYAFHFTPEADIARQP